MTAFNPYPVPQSTRGMAVVLFIYMTRKQTGEDADLIRQIYVRSTADVPSDLVMLI